MNQVLSTEICSKCVAGQAAEAPNLIYPKWGASGLAKTEHCWNEVEASGA